MRKVNRVDKVCKVCDNNFKVVKSRELTSRFCSNNCRFTYYSSSEGQKERRESSKKQWINAIDRKEKLSSRMKERMSLEESKKQSKKHLEKYNSLHKGKGNGRKHTQEHKEYMRQLLTNRIFSKDTINNMVKSHWSRKVNREEVIKKFTNTKNKKISSGEITFNSLGISGSYVSTKTNIQEKYDSLTELFRMVELDKDPLVDYWTKKHKIVIPYTIGLKEKNYIPDFLIIKNRKKIIEEIKSSWSEKLHGELNAYKKEAAFNFAKLNNYEFIWHVIDLDYLQRKEIKTIHKL